MELSLSPSGFVGLTGIHFPHILLKAVEWRGRWTLGNREHVMTGKRSRQIARSLKRHWTIHGIGGKWLDHETGRSSPLALETSAVDWPSKSLDI